MWPEKKRTNAWQCPEQETTDLAAEERPMKLEEINKESSSLLTTEKLPSEYNPLNGPGPLGLKLKKSRSFLELLEMMLKQANKNDNSMPSQNLQVGNKKAVKAKVAASNSLDKLKASNFPALLLKIGDWKYVSKYEGDLVAKCYFSKHKLVWEVLEDGLKNKIEIQWEDIVGLKANFPENGPGTLTVVLGKEPLFFKETTPQPRKHTIWQSTSDFTNGEARRLKHHHLQCGQGVLNRHYEKLIHCDTRLNFLSQQFYTLVDKLFPEASIKTPSISHNIAFNRPEMSNRPSVDIDCMVLQPTSQCLLKDANLAQKDIWKNDVNGWQDGNYYSSPQGMISSSPSQCLLKVANHAQKDTSEDLENGSQDGNNYSNHVRSLPSDDFSKQWWEQDVGNVSGYEQDFAMSRKDSYTDLLHQLPTWFSSDAIADEQILYR